MDLVSGVTSSNVKDLKRSLSMKDPAHEGPGALSMNHTAATVAEQCLHDPYQSEGLV